MTAYYNEIDPFAAAWLRELINAGLIAPGVVDERSIEDVRPDDLAGYTQCHFFAGIGGWSYALHLAGWPDNKPIWTASCPCQPFSAAGKSVGFDDERHMWPSVHWLARQQGPRIIIGEQVASKAAEPWLDLVQADLEALGYAFGAVAFPSASVGAPHNRDRTYWVADSYSSGLEKRICEQRIQREKVGAQARETPIGSSTFNEKSTPVNGFWAPADWLGGSDGLWRAVECGSTALADGVPAKMGRVRGYGNAINAIQAAEFIKAIGV